MEEWAHDETRVVDHVMGAFFLMKRSLFEALGGFDERFFVYFEDLDFSRRAFEAGWASLYWTGSCIWHLGGGSSRRVLGMRLFYSLRSRLIYARKHHGPRAFALISFSTLLVEPFLRLLRSPASTVSLIEAYSRLVVWFFSADARRVLGSPR
jgi:GT2 family glycosyltransferase